jgi:hypothetical protein
MTASKSAAAQMTDDFFGRVSSAESASSRSRNWRMSAVSSPDLLRASVPEARTGIANDCKRAFPTTRRRARCGHALPGLAERRGASCRCTRGAAKPRAVEPRHIICQRPFGRLALATSLPRGYVCAARPRAADSRQRRPAAIGHSLPPRGQELPHNERNHRRYGARDPG